MKYTKRKPVSVGDEVYLTVCGVYGLYKCKRGAEDVMNLRPSDLQLVQPLGLLDA